uniref:Uncharacterized protein n=1 Tax=Brassica oleracea var. oleracea TaxID=109376 RepID=A0A0D3DKZ2_BRAOL
MTSPATSASTLLLIISQKKQMSGGKQPYEQSVLNTILSHGRRLKENCGHGLADSCRTGQRKRLLEHSSAVSIPTLQTIAITSTTRPAQTPRKLSWEEVKRKRTFCICDEKYAPGHKCANPQIFIMEGIDDHDSDDADTEEEDTTPEITLNALTGWDSPTTMRLLAIISNHDLHALVDCGSTHNYVSEKMVIELKLQETPTKPFDIHVANGTPLRC